jgi:signal transduction histidine kinase
MKRAAEAFDLKDIHLQVEVGGMAVLADPLLEKVFYNLVENSLRHGGKIHEISLTIERQGGELRIVYKDDGKGIPQKDKERIFRRGHGNHTGFGLYAAREVLSLTGMSIIENGLEGHGARFSITVPDRFNRSG